MFALDEDEYVLNCLEKSQATMEINFKNLPLGSQFTLIVKSIQKEASLQILDFSGCAFEDDGLKVISEKMYQAAILVLDVQLLSGALENLENLKSLNLSCNYITSNGLRELIAKVGNEISLPVSKQCGLTSHCDVKLL